MKTFNDMHHVRIHLKTFQALVKTVITTLSCIVIIALLFEIRRYQVNRRYAMKTYSCNINEGGVMQIFQKKSKC